MQSVKGIQVYDDLSFGKGKAWKWNNGGNKRLKEIYQIEFPKDIIQKPGGNSAVEDSIACSRIWHNFCCVVEMGLFSKLHKITPIKNNKRI